MMREALRCETHDEGSVFVFGTMLLLCSLHKYSFRENSDSELFYDQDAIREFIFFVKNGYLWRVVCGIVSCH